MSQTSMDIIYIVSGSVLIFGTLIFSLVSFWEKERLAGQRLLLAVLFLILIFSSPYFLSEGVAVYLKVGIIGLIGLSFAILFFPFRLKKKLSDVTPVEIKDERDVMFSRCELEPGHKNFQDFYKRNPEKKMLDDTFRKEAGLLQKGSYFYHPLIFASANAGFDTVEAFSKHVDGEPAKEKQELEKEKITLYIKEWMKHAGAHTVGVCELRDYHLYSVLGRGDRYGKKTNNTHKYAIALTVEMDYYYTGMGPHGPITMESAQQYLEAGKLATELAYFIRRIGYSARAHIDGNYELVCPLVARDAGLGEIGRMGLLMTPDLGPRVRIAVVSTDLDLVCDDRNYDPTVTEFCRVCKKCADTCPSQAISHDDRALIHGIQRWQINSEKCFTYWCKSGTDCGRCMAVCPYSHPNNFMHQIIRFCIKHFPVFRQMAVVFDDLVYRRKPEIRKMEKWMMPEIKK